MGNIVELIGGQNHCDLYVVKLKPDKSGYDFYDIFTDPSAPAVVASPTRTSAKPLTLNAIGKTKPSPQDNGLCNLDFEQYDSQQDIFTFLDVVAKASDSGSTATWKYENGTERRSSATGGFLVLAIPYLGKNEAVTPNEVLVHPVIGVVPPSSGAFETDPDAPSKPSFSVNGMKNEAAMDIPDLLFYSHASDPNLGLVDTQAIAAWNPTIAKSKCFIRKYVAVPNGA